MKNTGVLILAGGESRRMNFPKPFLPAHGKTFLDRIVEGYLHAGVTRIVVVLNHNLVASLPYSVSCHESVLVVENRTPEYGRYYSFRLGIRELQDVDSIYVHNCDNPVVNPGVLNDMYAARAAGTYVVPVFEGRGGHPVLLSKEIAGVVLSDERSYSSLRDALGSFSRTEVPVDAPEVLININSRADYDAYLNNYSLVLSE
jgi:molybdenum cofactor cytidylyltransferase